MEHIRTRGH